MHDFCKINSKWWQPWIHSFIHFNCFIFYFRNNCPPHTASMLLLLLLFYHSKKYINMILYTHVAPKYSFLLASPSLCAYCQTFQLFHKYPTNAPSICGWSDLCLLYFGSAPCQAASLFCGLTICIQPTCLQVRTEVWTLSCIRDTKLKPLVSNKINVLISLVELLNQTYSVKIVQGANEAAELLRTWSVSLSMWHSFQPSSIGGLS